MAPQPEGEEELGALSGSRKTQNYLDQSAYTQNPIPKPETHLVELTHKKQRAFVKNQKGGGGEYGCVTDSDRKRRGKVKVPPLYKVRIMGRKAEGGSV
jgi:hypothetical protein